jgi:hypothetical protein
LTQQNRASRFNAESDYQSIISNPSPRTEASPNSYVGFVDSLELAEHISSPPNIETNITSHNDTPTRPSPITLCAVLAWYPSTDYTRTREQRRSTCSRKDHELSSIFTNLFDESYLYPPGSIALESPYLSPSLSLSLFLSFYLSISINFHLYFNLHLISILISISIFLSISTYTSICLSVYLSIPIPLSISIPISISVSPSTLFLHFYPYPFIYISIPIFISLYICISTLILYVLSHELNKRENI